MGSLSCEEEEPGGRLMCNVLFYCGSNALKIDPPPPFVLPLSGDAQMGCYFAQERYVEVNDALITLSHWATNQRALSALSYPAWKSFANICGRNGNFTLLTVNSRESIFCVPWDWTSTVTSQFPVPLFSYVTTLSLVVCLPQAPVRPADIMYKRKQLELPSPLSSDSSRCSTDVFPLVSLTITDYLPCCIHSTNFLHHS